MSIWLEDKVREAILGVCWKQVGDGPDPRYFVNAKTGSLQLESSAASFLAHVITDQIIIDGDKEQDNSVDEELDKYSSEVLASYLEARGYIVSSPDFP